MVTAGAGVDGPLSGVAMVTEARTSSTRSPSTGLIRRMPHHCWGVALVAGIVEPSIPHTTVVSPSAWVPRQARLPATDVSAMPVAVARALNGEVLPTPSTTAASAPPTA